MKVAKFPAPGSVVHRLLVSVVPTSPREGEHPDAFARRREWAEALAHVVVGVRMLRDDRVAELGHEYTMIVTAEQRRLKAIEDSGEAVPALTPEGQKAIRAYHKQVIGEAVAYVRGVEVGEVLSDGLTGDNLVDLVRDAGLLADVSTCAREAQRPTPVQLER